MKKNPMELSKIWMNGKIMPWKKAQVHVLTHALHYGTGIFEGIRCYNTSQGPAIFRLTDHLARMYRGAKAYYMDVPYSFEQLRKACFATVKANKVDHCYLRPLIYRGYKRIGLSITNIPTEVAIAPVNFDHYFSPVKAEKGLKCAISSWTRTSAKNLSPHIKATANYLNSVLAKAEAERDGYDEAIMLTESGHVSEGSAENIFIARKGKLITPPFYDEILGGITRESVIDIARKNGYLVEEKTILRDELLTADEVFFTGTASEIIHVSSIDGITIGNGRRGPITKTVQESFRKIVTGKDPSYAAWLEYVK